MSYRLILSSNLSNKPMVYFFYLDIKKACDAQRRSMPFHSPAWPYFSGVRLMLSGRIILYLYSKILVFSNNLRDDTETKFDYLEERN